MRPPPLLPCLAPAGRHLQLSEFRAQDGLGFGLFEGLPKGSGLKA